MKKLLWFLVAAWVVPGLYAAGPPHVALSPGAFIYRVTVSGDSLSKIAKRFCGDMFRYPEIAKANGLKDPNLIHVGDSLSVPCKASEREVSVVTEVSSKLPAASSADFMGVVDAPPMNIATGTDAAYRALAEYSVPGNFILRPTKLLKDMYLIFRIPEGEHVVPGEMIPAVLLHKGKHNRWQTDSVSAFVFGRGGRIWAGAKLNRDMRIPDDLAVRFDDGIGRYGAHMADMVRYEIIVPELGGAPNRVLKKSSFRELKAAFPGPKNAFSAVASVLPPGLIVRSILWGGGSPVSTAMYYVGGMAGRIPGGGTPRAASKDDLNELKEEVRDLRRKNTLLEERLNELETKNDRH